MIIKDNPTVLTSSYHVESPEEYVMTPDKFSFAFAMENATTFQTYKNRSLFRVYLNQCTKKPAIDPITKKTYNDINCVDLPLETCDIKKHFKIESLKPYYERLDLTTFYCLNMETQERTPPVIQGSFDADIFKWLRLTVESCQNQTGIYEECATQEEIDRQLSAGYLSMYWSDMITDPQKPGDPSTFVGRNTFQTFSNSMSKELNVFLKHQDLISDDGYMTTSNTEYNAVQFSFRDDFIDTRKTPDFINFVFKLDQQKTVVYRSYQKLQDILGLVGGLWQVLTVIGLVIVSPINKLDLQIKILNSVFSFEVDDGEKQHSQNHKMSDHDLGSGSGAQSQKKHFTPMQSNIGTDPLQHSDRALDSKRVEVHRTTKKVFNQLRDFKYSTKGNQPQTLQKQRKMLEVFKNYFKMNLGKLKLQTKEYVWFFIACVKTGKPKKNQIEFALKKMGKQIDILYIMKKMTELEKLKMLILTKQQLQLFDYLPKPCIPRLNILSNYLRESSDCTIQEKFENLLSNSEDKQMSYWHTIQGEKTIYQRASEAFDAYESLQKKTRKSLIDERLIKFLDDRIRKLFEMGMEKKNKKDKVKFSDRPMIQSVLHSNAQSGFQSNIQSSRDPNREEVNEEAEGVPESDGDIMIDLFMDEKISGVDFQNEMSRRSQQ